VTTSVPSGPWAPLREPVYRRLWLAQVVSNLGTWMQTVGAQWVIVSASGSVALVSLVQTASTLPVVLLAAPAGVLADVLDRRRVLVTVQSVMVVIAAALAALTFLGDVDPTVMLGFTFLLGAGAAFVGPAWQAIQPELVPRAQLPQAAALGAVNMNLARAVGPAIAGVLVAAVGAGWVFALNAVSFLVVALAVSSWRREATPDPVGREPLVAALRSGARYVRYAPAMRRVLVRCMLFVPAASCLWALLPLVATRLLGLGSGGYGLLLGCLGVGAVVGAVVLPRVRDKLGSEPVTLALFLLYAAVLCAVGSTSSTLLCALLLTLAGAAWLGVLSTLNATAQQVLPAWVRARALSYYLVVFMAGQALGGIVWGAIAERTGVRGSFVIAGVVLAVGAVAARWWPLVDPARLDPTLSEHWAVPDFPEPDPQAGPVLVTAEYFVPAEAQQEFIAALPPLSRSRRRTGASEWQMFQDPADPARFVEVFLVATWAEHARQHQGRLTKIDRVAEERVRALAGGAPVVRHLLAIEARPRSRRRR
jgi:MFS family permease